MGILGVQTIAHVGKHLEATFPCQKKVIAGRREACTSIATQLELFVF